MSAQPSYANLLPSTSLPLARFSRRVVTEVRQLASKALWVRFDPDADTGLQNFTSSLVGEFQDVLDSLTRPVSSIPQIHPELPRYTVLQSSHPEYFSVG